jgi:hypothetical protein
MLTNSKLGQLMDYKSMNNVDTMIRFTKYKTRLRHSLVQRDVSTNLYLN